MDRRLTVRPLWGLVATLPLVVASVGLPAVGAQAATGVGASADSSAAPTVRAAAPKPGAKCPKKNKTIKTKKYGKLKCTKVGKKLVWKRVPKPKPVAPTPTLTPTPTPAPVASCAAGGTCAIGDTGPGGGKIFYLAGDPSFRYLEAALTDVGPGALCDRTAAEWVAIGAGALEGRTGAGASNTMKLAAACSTGVADEVDAYVSGGKDDWFVPDSNELSFLFDENASSNLGLFGVTSTHKYWTSTNVVSGGLFAHAWTLTPSNSTFVSIAWTTPTTKVRPIRLVV